MNPNKNEQVLFKMSDRIVFESLNGVKRGGKIQRGGVDILPGLKAEDSSKTC